MSQVRERMSYAELVAGNAFGGMDVTMPIILTAESRPREVETEEKVKPKKSILDVCKDLNISSKDLFNEARTFLQERQKNPIDPISYDENLRFVALLRQSKFGKCDPSLSGDLGFLNVVGNDRKRAWMSLGDMSKEDAMEQFIRKIFSRFPSFNEHLERVRENNRLRKEDEFRRAQENQQILHLAHIEEQRKKYEEFQRKRIQQTLNQQTESQFRAYAEQHHRDNPKAQQELIRQLQEEHLQQYLRQVYQQQLQNSAIRMEQQQTISMTSPSDNLVTQVQIPSTLSTQILQNSLPPLGPAPVQLPPIFNPPPPPSTLAQLTNPVENQFESLSLQTPLEPIGNLNENSTLNETKPTTESQNEATSVVPTSDGSDPSANIDGNDSNDQTNIVAANMWTRKDMKEFKDQLRKEKDAVIKIGSGETVTVRVPTHDEGQCIFWEFSTDYYDLGFGVYFEWSKSQSNTVTVHVSDSSEEDEENEDGTNPEKKDVEKGGPGSTNKPAKPRQDEIVPICRRDCHDEVYAGSHRYPGEGVYLLKFDNSYSLWRSKTLYYRVYYSK